MTDLNSLVLFAKVVEANSFSEAARRMKVPLSTVSRRIAELENQLGLRLLERSTRSLRLTHAGSSLLHHAQRTAELSDAVDGIASNHAARISGLLRLTAPPSISDSLIAPIICAFQQEHPDVRFQVMITERLVDQIDEEIDLAFRVGPMKDSTLVARRILTYRHQLVASPAYLAKHKAPARPQDLLKHRLLAFSRWKPENRWLFVRTGSGERETLTFQPYLSMNDYDGLAYALLDGVGIGDLPPIVSPGLLSTGRLVEVMPKWHLRTFHLTLVHLGRRHIPRPVQVFKDFAARMAPTLFPALPA
jgi:DNA-binding transcriptional LysR family regulator